MMDLTSYCLGGRTNSKAPRWKPQPLLPCLASDEKPLTRLGSPLGFSLYRRVLTWAFFTFALLAFLLYQSKGDSALYNTTVSQWSYAAPLSSSLDDYIPPTSHDNNEEEGDVRETIVSQSSVGQESEWMLDQDERWHQQYQEALQRTPWLRFKHLDGYFHGLKTLVIKSRHLPEWPNRTFSAPLPQPPVIKSVPKPKPYKPYASTPDIQTCYLDEDKKIPAPDMYAYHRVPQHIPDPAIGSYEVLGLRDDVCFDRFGRFGPYGLGYSRSEGGTGQGLDTEMTGADEVWSKSGKINYANMDWGAAQNRCNEANEHRFLQIDPETEGLERDNDKIGQTAIVIRLYTGFKWTDHAIINFRAMINELSLKSGGEYTVHFLLHVRDAAIPIWSDDVTVQRLLEQNVPPEFQGLVTLWSEAQIALYYPGKFEDAVSNPSQSSVHGVYRSAHLPLQIFALEHPEYEHFWNWEMDMRFLGNYYELLDRISKWSKQQARPLIWERNERYFIPSYHGTWHNFTETVAQNAIQSDRSTIFGRLDFKENKNLRFEQRGESVLPADCAGSEDKKTCGVGEAADYISFNPLFDADQSGWVFGLDVTGYGSNPPRRCAIITASRMSRRLLEAMHEEVWRHHHTMFSEMFPPTVAMHHGFKAVYAPHPVYLDRAWNPPSSIDAAFNGGRDHSTSGHGSPYDLMNEHNHKGTSWYYNSEFSALAWRRWLGYPQLDGRGNDGGYSSRGDIRGGLTEEAGEAGTGRMCLRSMLLHPIKKEHPAED